MGRITVSTKCWEGDWRTVLERAKTFHFDQLVMNNVEDPKTVEKAAKKLIDRVIIAEEYIKEAKKALDCHPTPNAMPYSISELVEIYLADGLLVHYASDVIPPSPEWITEAIPLLDKYTAVSPFWEADVNDFAKHHPQMLERTDFGFTTPYFSDQAYLIDPSVFRKKVYNHKHSIGDDFPEHGHDDFEKRIAMWLADTNQRRAVLTKYRYFHIDSRNK